jgi:hypothetical protein
VSPILHAFSKSGTKPLPYPKQPYFAEIDKVKTEEEQQQEAENERLKALVYFKNWADAVGKQFKNETQDGGVS